MVTRCAGRAARPPGHIVGPQAGWIHSLTRQCMRWAPMSHRSHPTCAPCSQWCRGVVFQRGLRCTKHQ
eukprot:2650883-Pyramimonas_sp.AAC.1